MDLVTQNNMNIEYTRRILNFAALGLYKLWRWNKAR